MAIPGMMPPMMPPAGAGPAGPPPMGAPPMPQGAGMPNPLAALAAKLGGPAGQVLAGGAAAAQGSSFLSDPMGHLLSFLAGAGLESVAAAIQKLASAGQDKSRSHHAVHPNPLAAVAARGPAPMSPAVAPAPPTPPIGG